MDLKGWLIIVGIVVVVIGVYVKARRRREALESVALQLGWAFDTNSKEALTEHDGLGLFSSLASRSYSSVVNLLKVTSVDCWVFEHVDTAPRPDTQGRRVTTVASFRLGVKCLPRFSLSPETVFQQLGLSGRDIDFASHPFFSAAYFLHAGKGEDEQAVRALFPPAVLDFFTGEGGWSVEGASDRLLVYRARQVVKPEAEALARFFDQTRQIARLFGVIG